MMANITLETAWSSVISDLGLPLQRAMQASSARLLSSALVISLPWVVQAMHFLEISDLNSQIPLCCFQ